MIQKFAAKVLSFYEVRNTRVTEYLLIKLFFHNLLSWDFNYLSYVSHSY